MTETPQGAWEVERRERAWVDMLDQTLPVPVTDREWRALVAAAMRQADREHVEREAALVAERDALHHQVDLLTGGDLMVLNALQDAEEERDAMQRDLAQAVSERDRLRAEVTRLRGALGYIACPTMGYVSTQQDPVTPEVFARERATDRMARVALTTCIGIATRALATPDADAQDEGTGVVVERCEDWSRPGHTAHRWRTGFGLLVQCPESDDEPTTTRATDCSGPVGSLITDADAQDEEVRRG